MRFGLVLAVLVAWSPAAAIAAPDGAWKSISPPSARESAASAYDSSRDRMLVFGGLPGYLNDVWSFDLATEIWTRLEPTGLPPSPRFGAIAIYDAPNDRLIVFGGDDGLVQNNDIWALSFSGPLVWTRLTPSGAGPIGRSFPAGVFDAPRDRLVIFGGYDGASFLGDTWALSLAGTPAWDSLATSGGPPPVRDLAAAAFDSAREQIVVFGGWNGSIFLDDTWTLSLNGPPQWTPLSPDTTPGARRGLVIVYDATDDELVLFGGFFAYGTTPPAIPTNDVWSLSLADPSNWKMLTPASATVVPRHGHTGIFDPVRHELIAFGGHKVARVDSGLADGRQTNEILRLDLGASPAWRSVSTPALESYSLAFDPVTRDVLMFSGQRAALAYEREYDDSLHAMRLSDALPHWTTIATAGATPGPRSGHRAVWDATRDRMLIFGGVYTSNLNELWEYRPRPSPTWTALTPTGSPPLPRTEPGMVLDAKRDRLLIFGGLAGYPSGNPANDLWELPLSGPSAMQWKAVTTQGSAPSPRWGVVMLVDSTRDRAIVIAGGADAANPTIDVFALDLNTSPPTWSQVITMGPPPQVRVLAAGAIDPVDDRLVLFGGYNGAFLTGAWSLPLSGVPQWSLLDPAGATPSPRGGIAAIYDSVGHQMLIPCGYHQATSDAAFHDDVVVLRFDAQVTTVSLVDSLVATDHVLLTWEASGGASMTGQVERRTATGGWATLGAAVAAGAGRLQFDDLTVTTGADYFYRLRADVQGVETLSNEVEIVVPGGGGPGGGQATLQLAGARPNPTQGGPLSVSFSLAQVGDGHIDLLDLFGRRLTSVSIDGLPAGPHLVRLYESSQIDPGLYFVRLVTPGQTLTSKALVTR